jgi:hypothetical protein
MVITFSILDEFPRFRRRDCSWICTLRIYVAFCIFKGFVAQILLELALKSVLLHTWDKIQKSGYVVVFLQWFQTKFLLWLLLKIAQVKSYNIFKTGTTVTANQLSTKQGQICRIDQGWAVPVPSLHLFALWIPSQRVISVVHPLVLGSAYRTGVFILRGPCQQYQNKTC